jgi:general secretion pathway protein C
MIVHKRMTVKDTDQTLSATGSSSEREGHTVAPIKPYTAYQAIVRRDLFKTPKGENLPQEGIDIEALKPTELKLKLWGTITGEDGFTRAVIEDQTQKEQAFYRTGEEVASAQIKLILRDKVVLSVKGEDQILEMEQPSGVGGPSLVSRVGPNVNRPVAASPAVPRAPVSRSIRMKLSRLGTISDNPEEWNKEASVSPIVNDQGEPGLTINRITPSSPLRRLGIRNGDVVVSINDQPVEELADVFETLKEISEGETLSLNIKRRGRERQLDFQFE